MRFGPAGRGERHSSLSSLPITAPLFPTNHGNKPSLNEQVDEWRLWTEAYYDVPDIKYLPKGRTAEQFGELLFVDQEPVDGCWS